MSELVRKIAVFVGSPSDVEAERKIVSEAVDDLNIAFGSSRNIVLEVKKWETHVWPGFGEDEKSAAVADLNDRVSRQEVKLNEQEESLRRQQHVINQLVTYSMAEYVYRHLRHIYAGKRGTGSAEYLFRKNGAFEHDLRFLRDHGYIEFIDIDTLRDGDNLVKKIDLTPVGNFYVELRGGTPKAK